MRLADVDGQAVHMSLRLYCIPLVLWMTLWEGGGWPPWAYGPWWPAAVRPWAVRPMAVYAQSALWASWDLLDTPWGQPR